MMKTLLIFLILPGFAVTLPMKNVASMSLSAKAPLGLNSSTAQAEDAVANQTVWEGKCSQGGVQPYPMIMLVRERKNNEITGILHWPTIGNSKTKFKGKIKDDIITFTEYELIQGGGVALPTLYEGKIVDDLISGTWVYADDRGTFFLQLVKRTKN